MRASVYMVSTVTLALESGKPAPWQCQSLFDTISHDGESRRPRNRTSRKTALAADVRALVARRSIALPILRPGPNLSRLVRHE
ncbi:MAG TPA: hypothetical protein VGK58_12220 [Lacipirellulaceae bacterium]